MHARPQPQTRASSKSPPRPDYVRSVHLPATDAASALARAKHALGREGFNIIAEIDFRDLLRRTLDKDVGAYWVLETCNPNLTARAVAADPHAGLLTAYKVAVWQEKGGAVVAALRPEVVARAAGDERLAAIALEAERYIERALVHVDVPERELEGDDDEL